jgi:hypothetical protein
MIAKNKGIDDRITERLDNLIEEFQRKGLITEREALIIKDRATKDFQELLEVILLTGYCVNSSKLACSVVSPRGVGTAPPFHGKATD